MSAATLIRQAHDAGVSLRLLGGVVKASGNRVVVAGMVDQLRQHKGELVEFLQAAHQTTVALLAAADVVCDHFGDRDAARREMRLQCMDTPIHLRADLLDHFNQTYPQTHKPEGN